MRKLLVLLSPLLILGCQTWEPTWSEVSGSRYYNLTTLNRWPAIITGIDDHGAFRTKGIYRRDTVKVEPGRHEITVQGTLPGWTGPDLETIVLTLEPCKRYYINAQYPGPIQPRFTPIVDYVEDIAGCKIVTAAK